MNTVICLFVNLHSNSSKISSFKNYCLQQLKIKSFNSIHEPLIYCDTSEKVTLNRLKWILIVF